jgi:hypothetical protein
MALVASSVCVSRDEHGTWPAGETGVPEWRLVPAGVDTDELLRRSQQGIDASDTSGAAASAANLDRTLALALARLREAQAERRVGELSGRHLALCGPMAASERSIRGAARAAAKVLREERVDAVLLVPT